jgi:ribose 5-phosphate isomerase A
VPARPDEELAAARQRAAALAVALVEDGMVVGLGTGRTAAFAIRALAERVAGGLRVTGVPTSRASEALARELGVPLRTPPDAGPVDLTIDGADELDGALRLVKGGGGALLREKLVARASRRMVVVADADKRVERLGARARLPVELVAFGASWTVAALAAAGLEPRLRDGVVSDNGGLLCDLTIPPAADLAALAAALDGMTGVVEHGLFLTEAERAFVGTADGVELVVRGGG